MNILMKTLRERRVALVTISAILLCVLYGGYRISESKLDTAAVHEQTLENAVRTVAVTNAQPMAPTETITLPGNIVAWFEAPIYAQVSGYVKMWYADYGALVKKGDILADINAPALDAQYAQVQADLESERALYGLADITAKRWVAMRRSHAVSEQSITVKVAEARAQAAKVSAAEQNVKNFEAMIRFKTIIAPYDGVVTVRNVNVGDYVTKEGNITNRHAGANLFTVADVSRMRLFVNMPESFGAYLNPGLTANVTVPQLPDRHFTAKFRTVARGFDPDMRTAVTEFTIDNEDKALWPDSYATVLLTVPTHRTALTIPSSAMVFQEHGTQVAVVTEDDRVHFKAIAVGKILTGTIEVTEGISVTDRIVTHPNAALLEGNKVRIVTPATGYHLVGKEVLSHALAATP